VFSAYRNRRRLATGSAMMLAALLGYYAVAGDNGITVYKQKKIEDRQLAKQIEDLKQENARLQAHIERLQNDPNAIEHEAREKLHYARPGEVIYTIPDTPNRSPAATAMQNSGKQAPDASSQPAASPSNSEP
jgi:cell division protein FtsB